MSSNGVRPRTSDIRRIVENSPSRSLMLVLTFSAIYSMASSSISAPISSALERRIAHLSSNLGNWRSKAPAQVRREARRSSTDLIWLGKRSDVTMICLFNWYKALKILKNSSWLFSLPTMNWKSSMIKQSRVWNFWLNSLPLPFKTESIKSA